MAKRRVKSKITTSIDRISLKGFWSKKINPKMKSENPNPPPYKHINNEKDIDISTIPDGWKKLFEIRQNQSLLFIMMHEGYERTFASVQRRDREFLKTVQHIAGNPELIMQKIISMRQEAPDIRELPPL